MTDTAIATPTPLLPADVQLREDAAVGAAIRRAFASRGDRSHIDLRICPPSGSGGAWDIIVNGTVHLYASDPDLATALTAAAAGLENGASW